MQSRSSFTLSMIFCAILVLAAINGLLLKVEIFTELLWIAFGVWMVLFFVFLIHQFIQNRKMARNLPTVSR